MSATLEYYQVNPSATTVTALLTCATGRKYGLRMVSVCNIGASALTFRLALRKAGATLANGHYLRYSQSVPAGEAIAITYDADELVMNQGDILQTYVSSADAAFTVSYTNFPA